MPSVTEPEQAPKKPKTSVSNKEETEEEILNKIETEAMDVVEDNLDSRTEDSILNEEEENRQLDKEEVKVVINSLDNADGDFKSLHGVETPEVDRMEVEKEEPVIQQISMKSFNAEEPKEVEPTVPMPIKEEPEDKKEPTEDEVELLDISMVRETEEDDACAIADAMDDKETQRSDEDQSEKAETEQDNSDTQDEENNANGFVVSEEDGENDNAINKENVVIEDDAQSDKTDEIIDKDNNSDTELVIDETKNVDDKRKSKRTLSINGIEALTAKKPKLVDEEAAAEIEPKSVEASVEAAPKETEPPYKIQTLTSFADFMQCRKVTKKLSRSDLEEICIQKICEVLSLKSTNGELNDMIRKHEESLAIFRKDIHQINKQYKDLDIVHKKLLAELKTQKEANFPKPLVPLKITRSVGLQVRLTPGHEANQNKRRQSQKTILSPLGKQVVKKVVQQPPPPTPTVRQVVNVQKAVNSAPMLSQALQKQKPKPPLAKKPIPSPIKKPIEATKKPTGVIDLTDEDDRRSAGTNGIKFRTVPATNTRVVANNNQNKLGNKLPSALPQGLRLTPASATTTSPQMLYVVPTITSNAGGQQKVAFVNFQPSNTMLSGALNGAVLNKPGQLTIKNVATTNTVSSSCRTKHPAPLPVNLRVNSDPNMKLTLPKPMLTIKKLDNGIILQWKMPYNLDLYEKIASYQLYAYQETTSLPSTEMWRKVGDVKALALPMACTLTQFADKNKYYFAVRAVDVHQRIGAFSEPEEISL